MKTSKLLIFLFISQELLILFLLFSSSPVTKSGYVTGCEDTVSSILAAGASNEVVAPSKFKTFCEVQYEKR